MDGTAKVFFFFFFSFFEFSAGNVESLYICYVLECLEYMLLGSLFPSQFAIFHLMTKTKTLTC